MQKELELVLKELAKKYNRPVQEIEDIVRAPYYLAIKVMESGDRQKGIFFNIRIRGLGIFRVCDRTIKRMLEQNRRFPNSNYDRELILMLKGLKKQKIKQKKYDKFRKLNPDSKLILSNNDTYNNIVPGNKGSEYQGGIH